MSELWPQWVSDQIIEPPSRGEVTNGGTGDNVLAAKVSDSRAVLMSLSLRFCAPRFPKEKDSNVRPVKPKASKSSRKIKKIDHSQSGAQYSAQRELGTVHRSQQCLFICPLYNKSRRVLLLRFAMAENVGLKFF